jgi:hypothetical protein
MLLELGVILGCLSLTCFRCIAPNFRSSFVVELSFFPWLPKFRSSFVIARVLDLLLSFLRATHGWGRLLSRNVPTKSFETVVYGPGTLSFFTTKHKLNDVY